MPFPSSDQPSRRATSWSMGSAATWLTDPVWRSWPPAMTARSSPMLSSSSRSWVTCTAGMSSSASSSCSSMRISSRVGWSSADSGSSSSSRPGLIASARARATRWRSPPLSQRGDRLASCESPSWHSSESVSAPEASRLARGPNLTFSLTDRCGKRAASWKTRPMRRRSAGTPVRSAPARRIFPERWGRSPAMVSRSMVLPAPDGPSSASTRPAATPRSIGPRLKDPARPASPLTSSPWSAVGTVNPGQQSASGQRAEDQERGQRDDQQHDGGRC